MGERHVTIRFLDEFPNKILDIAADVAGLAKLGRVCLDERHLDQIRDVFDEVGFSDPGRPNEDDVLLCIFGLLGANRIFVLQLANVIHMVVVIADRDRKDLLGFILLDHEPIEVRLNIARQEIEHEMVAGLFDRFLFVAGLGPFRLREGCEGNLVPEVRFHELGELGLQFFRCGKWWILIHQVRRGARCHALTRT